MERYSGRDRMLEVSNLRKTYRSGGKVVEAVKGISFSANLGEVFTILGPNGAGKSTTIKSILGLVLPDSGSIHVNGIDIMKSRKKALKYMSAVLEGNRNVHWRLSVKENMIYFGGMRGLGGRKLKSRMEEVASLLGISDRMDQLAGKLSRGYQQRLAIAIALLPDTPVILLDEPTLGLDVESSVEIREVIRKLAEDGKLVLLSTHDMKLVENVADRVMVINKGKLITLKKPSELKEMFKSRSYKIVFDGDVPETLRERLSDFGRFIEDGDKTALVVSLKSADEIYNLFDVLRLEKPAISSIESEEPDFEEIFMRIVRGDEE